jgi:hypothetical protein
MEFTESAEKIRDFLHGCLKKYTEEPFTCWKDSDGNHTANIRYVKIFDPVLLEEIIQYSDDGNFDRIIAAESSHRASNEIRSYNG